MFFPKDWYWGWAEFDLAPPHNEVDPNLCAANSGQYGGINAQCNAFARYMISGNGRDSSHRPGMARRLNFFFTPNFLFGKNVPQYLYTWSWSGIGMEYKWGVGVDLPKRFEFASPAHPTWFALDRATSRWVQPGLARMGPGASTTPSALGSTSAHAAKEPTSKFHNGAAAAGQLRYEVMTSQDSSISWGGDSARLPQSRCRRVVETRPSLLPISVWPNALHPPARD